MAPPQIGVEAPPWSEPVAPAPIPLPTALNDAMDSLAQAEAYFLVTVAADGVKLSGFSRGTPRDRRLLWGSALEWLIHDVMTGGDD